MQAARGAGPILTAHAGAACSRGSLRAAGTLRSRHAGLLALGTLLRPVVIELGGCLHEADDGLGDEFPSSSSMRDMLGMSETSICPTIMSSSSSATVKRCASVPATCSWG